MAFLLPLKNLKLVSLDNNFMILEPINSFVPVTKIFISLNSYNREDYYTIELMFVVVILPCLVVYKI